MRLTTTTTPPSRLALRASLELAIVVGNKTITRPVCCQPFPGSRGTRHVFAEAPASQSQTGETAAIVALEQL